MPMLQTNDITHSPLKWGKNLVTMMLGLWLMVGVFIDGFAHNHDIVESFFTPWHAILYSGYLATSIWILWLVFQNQKRTGQSFLNAIPSGYGLGVIGIFVFLFGGIGDMLWHVIFGIEKDIAALLSPTHLLLLTGVLFILTSPFRMAWNDKTLTNPTWKEFLPTLLSIGLTMSVISFFLMYAWSFRSGVATQEMIDYYTSHFSAHDAKELLEVSNVRGFISFLITNSLLMLPVFLLMGRWKVPFGTVTFLFTLETSMMSILNGFSTAPSILLGIVSGIVADFVLRSLRPDTSRMWAYRVFAIVVPMVMWSLYFIGIAFLDGLGWPPELWSGTIVLCALSSLGLSILAFPPKVEG